MKLNDQVEWSDTVTADDDGNVWGSLSLGSLPAADVTDIIEQACGEAWVRVLVGSSAAGDMAPSRSLYATVDLTAADSGGASTPGAATPTPISGGGSANTEDDAEAGRLPDTGIEDVPPWAWIAGLSAVGAGAIAAERLVRRRAARS